MPPRFTGLWRKEVAERLQAKRERRQLSAEDRKFLKRHTCRIRHLLMRERQWLELRRIAQSIGGPGNVESFLCPYVVHGISQASARRSTITGVASEWIRSRKRY